MTIAEHFENILYSTDLSVTGQFLSHKICQVTVTLQIVYLLLWRIGKQTTNTRTRNKTDAFWHFYFLPFFGEMWEWERLIKAIWSSNWCDFFSLSLFFIKFQNLWAISLDDLLRWHEIRFYMPTHTRILPNWSRSHE